MRASQDNNLGMEPLTQPRVSANTSAGEPVVVVGSGPVGLRFVEELFRHQPDMHVHLLGDEPFDPYNRVQLSAFLARQVERDDIDIPLPSSAKHPHFQFTAGRIQSIDRDKKTIRDQSGNEYAYGTLVLATGARAHIPNIPGRELNGVYTFRHLQDTEALYARMVSSRHTVVVGGGLLGLEAAKALNRFNTEVTVVQQATHLMNRQLDEEAAAILQHEVEAAGIKVFTGSGIGAIKGDTAVTAVETRNGQQLECDTVVFCAGITPNISLARNARIKVGVGVQVNDYLQTSDPNIFAIGECCEHEGITYGVVSPGYEQAAVAATYISNTSELTRYRGSQSVSRLKVLGVPVNSMGEVVDLMSRGRQQEIIHRSEDDSSYRKLVFHRSRVIGAMGVGDWPEFIRIEEALRSRRWIPFWQRYTFQRNGQLWSGKQAASVNSWPATAVICQCNNITQGELQHIITQGCSSLEEIQSQCAAGTVCGSCKPLIHDMLGSEGPVEAEKGASALLGFGLLAFLVVGLVLLWPEQQVADSVQAQPWFEKIWNDKFWKQVTGFSLLGLSVVGLLMSLRKRLSLNFMGGFTGWRFVHIGLGVLCTLVLMLHTGFHLGSNLNQLLMVNFLLVLLMGAFASSSLGIAGHLSSRQAMLSRKYTQWLHIVVSWPLPMLLAVHVLSVYYF